MKRNQTIDALKLLFACGIITIHASMFSNTNQVLRALLPLGFFRLGVPFFFVCSGYFFYRKIKNNQETKTYILRLVKLFLVYEAFDVLFQLRGYAHLLSTPFGTLQFIWSILSTGLNGIYWYLTSTIVSLLLLTPFFKKKQFKLVFIVGLLLYLLAGTNDAYGPLFAGTFIQDIAKFHTWLFRWPQAGLCMSLLYLTIGALLYEYQPKVKHLSVVTCISISVLLIEAYVLKNIGGYDANIFISLIVAVPLVFLWALEHPIDFKIPYLGDMSLYVYMIHQYIISIIGMAFPILWSKTDILSIASVIVTLAVVSMIVFRKHKKSMI